MNSIEAFAVEQYGIYRAAPVGSPELVDAEIAATIAYRWLVNWTRYGMPRVREEERSGDREGRSGDPT